MKTHVQQLDLVYIFTTVRDHASSSRTRLCFNSFDSFLQFSFDENASKRSTVFTRLFRRIVPFLDASKLSWGDTYSMSYTSVVFGNTALSLFILYTAYLNATSVVLSLSSCVKIAPVKKKKNKQIYLERTVTIWCPLWGFALWCFYIITVSSVSKIKSFNRSASQQPLQYVLRVISNAFIVTQFKMQVRW